MWCANNTKGRATEYLEYDCYEEMAVAQMARIGREIAAQFEIGRSGWYTDWDGWKSAKRALP